MSPPQNQFLVISGIYGSLFDPGASDIRELHATLKLLRKRKIPLIFTTDKAADEIFPLIECIGHSGPVVVESGGGIYIPDKALKVTFNYQRTIEGYKIIELGMQRSAILEKLRALKHTGQYKIIPVSELSPDEFHSNQSLSHEDVLASRNRRYSEPLFNEGETVNMQHLEAEIANMQLRLHYRGTHVIITGDHDEGSAIRFLAQLYREEFSPKNLVTIGLGDNFADVPMLHAVDLPVLLRQPDGGFDSRVGRRGLQFTKNPGHLGWSQAVTSLIENDSEA